MKRALVATASATLLLALLPGAVAADRVTKFEDHHVGFFCEEPVEGGFVFAHIDSSTAFGDNAGADVWLDPATPFEDAPTLTGGTETVQVTEGSTQVELSATFTVFDADGVEQGEAVLEGTMTPVGDPQPFEQPSDSNHHSNTEGTSQAYEGTGTLTLPDQTIELTNCFGDVTDVSVFEANPSSFVSSNDGVFISCNWDTPDMSAGFFAVQDKFGFYADAFLAKADLEAFPTGEFSGSMTVGSVTATIGLTDPTTGDAYSATAEATFEPIGSPVTSTILGSTAREKVTEQLLAASGQIDFSTGDSFVIDQESCFALEFDRHFIGTSPAGPKPGGPVPVNDTPAGAIEVAAGDSFNVQNRGASFEAEQPLTTCPEGEFDNMGRTLWYTIEGTGGPVTIDTAGSNFDTLIAVYQADGEDFTEIACIDDVFTDPLGTTYQAALTIDTVEGATYYVQIGGFLDFFGGDPQIGRLRVTIS